MPVIAVLLACLAAAPQNAPDVSGVITVRHGKQAIVLSLDEARALHQRLGDALGYQPPYRMPLYSGFTYTSPTFSSPADNSISIVPGLSGHVEWPTLGLTR